MKQLLKKIATLGAMSLFLTACGGGNGNTDSATPTLDFLREQGYFRIGVFGATPPFGYVTADGEFAGRDPYIARRLAYEFFGDENAVEFVNTVAANRIPYLLSYQVDIIVANFTVNAERAEQVDFALPYVRVALGIVAPDDSPFNSVYDLHNHDVIVTQGTTAQMYLTQNHPEINLLIFNDNTESFAALQDGRGHAMAHDNGLLFAWAHNNAGFRIVEGNLGNQDIIAPAIRQGEEDLLMWLNETILRLREEGFFYHVYEATLREHFHPDTNPGDHMYQ